MGRHVPLTRVRGEINNLVKEYGRLVTAIRQCGESNCSKGIVNSAPLGTKMQVDTRAAEKVVGLPLCLRYVRRAAVGSCDIYAFWERTTL